jgi:hypothetical protein
LIAFGLILVEHFVLKEPLVELNLLLLPLSIHQQHVLLLVALIHGVLLIVLLFKDLRCSLQFGVVLVHQVLRQSRRVILQLHWLLLACILLEWLIHVLLLLMSLSHCIHVSILLLLLQSIIPIIIHQE